MDSDYFSLGKRGTSFDLLIIPVFLFIFVIFLIYITFAWNQIHPGLADPNIPQTREFSGYISRSFTIQNSMFAWIMAGLFMALIISALMIKSNPAFFVITLLISIGALLASPILSNAYESISSNTEIANETETFSIPDNVMNNLPMWILFMFIVVAIVLFARFKLR